MRYKIENYKISVFNKFIYHFLLPRLSYKKQNNTIFITPDTKFIKKENDYTESDIFIHFSRLPDVISKRLEIPKKGYIKLNDRIKLYFILNEFRIYLEEKTNCLYKRFQEIPDERILALGDKIYSINQPVINYNRINNVLKYIPPCIDGIIKNLKKNRHLKYEDRQILSLFLKDAGVPVEETITYFRSNFKVSSDIFDKNYLYNIRHNYGLEGKRANYSCYSCTRIISKPTSFGCPFVNNMDFVESYLVEKCIDLEDLATEKNTHGCLALLKKLTNKKDLNFVSPVQFHKYYLEAEEKENQ